MTDEKFIHIHTHSHFSLLDGMTSPKEMVKVAKECGFKSLALTDHGTCGGLYHFQKACKDNEIKPILGMEGYACANHEVNDKDEKFFHIILLAKNEIGLQNLMKLSTMAELNGKYKKPRIDFNLLSKYREGLIMTTACIAGEIPQLLLNGSDSLRAVTGKYKDLFGDDLYIEIMKHKYFKSNPYSIEQERKENEIAIKLYKFAKEMGIKAIATNDVHYARKSDSKYHDILLAMQTKDTIKNPDRFTFDSDDFYLKTYEEMMALYKGAPELLSNTVEIGEKIEGTSLFKSSKDLLPYYQVPDGFSSEEEYLKKMVKDAMIAKGFIDKPEYRERIRFEMQTIIKCGYTRYFLILWDVINYARNNSIRIGVGRGSAVGSLCLHVLGVTQLDPIAYGLLFERFLNPDRISPPDVDVDFDDTRREEIIAYVTRKYGEDHCCKIGTYQSLKAKSIVRYVVKAMDLGNDWEIMEAMKKKNPNVKPEDPKKSLALSDVIAEQVPEGPNVTIEETYKECPDFRLWVDKYNGLYDNLRHMEGVLNSSGVHASGYVVCKNPVTEHIPLRKSGDQICCQFEGPEVEELGLLKFDFLGLKNITIVDKTLKMIKERHGIDIDIEHLVPNDPKVFEIFNGRHPTIDTRGIFQFESYGISKLLKEIHVDSFDDLIVANALYRPGPLGAGVHTLYSDYKHGRKPINPPHPRMKDILKDTYGIMVYQESFMKIATELAGFTKGQSDTLRKVVGKKKPELIKKEKLDEKFIEGCKKNGIEEKIGAEIFKQIEYFGGYGFNKCLSGDTNVFDKKSCKYYKLDELEEQFLNYNISKDFGNADVCKPDIVLDSFVNGEIVDDTVEDVFETGDKELFEVKLDNGIVLKCTMDHKFYCSDGKEHELQEIIEKELEIICD